MNKEEKICGEITFIKNGNAYIRREEGDILIQKKNTLNSFTYDEVEVSLISNREGIVTKIINRRKETWVGIVSKSSTNTFVMVDKLKSDFYIPQELTKNCQDGDKVLVRYKKWNNTKNPYGEVVEIIGKSGDNNTEMNSIMMEYGLPVNFPLDVIKESEIISDIITDEEISKRKDIRDIITFTIDGKTAKDFDDALSIREVGLDTEVIVSIADVSHYIKVGTLLDKEALKRSTSVYLVDRCIPMLPERLSNNLCSLNPNEDKLTFSVGFIFDKEFNIKDICINKTIINSDIRFTYEEVQEILDGKEHYQSNNLNTLNYIAKHLRSKRDSVQMADKEVQFELDENGKPIGVFFKEQSESNHLIEEFMLLANKSVGNFLKSKNIEFPTRVHDTPNIDKIESISKVCQSFGYDPILYDDKIKYRLNKLLTLIKGKPEDNMITSLVTRSMSKAKYSIDNIGHFGLGEGFDNYTHFTSPIRRCADLNIHRILSDILDGDKNYKSIDYIKICDQINKMEVLSSKAQRDSIKYKQVEYMSDKIGNIFSGVISGVTEWGLYVEIIENKCEGMVRTDYIYKSLFDNWEIYPDKYICVSDDTNIKISLGDVVNVKVLGINLSRKTIDFEII